MYQCLMNFVWVNLGPGMYNALVNKLFTPETNGDKRVNIKYILKQKPKGHASISDGITIDVNEIKGVYGRFQTGVIHTKDFGLKGNLDLDFFFRAIYRICDKWYRKKEF